MNKRSECSFLLIEIRNRFITTKSTMASVWVKVFFSKIGMILLMNMVVASLQKMDIKNDFEHGMKVSLNGEFGVVINSETSWSNLFGIVRWDTSKENDTEDWRGQFGTFIQLGGKILDENYSFQFINNDGSIKSK